MKADPDSGLEALGKNFRRARLDAGLSQRELADKVGVSSSLISQFETGLSRPSAGTLFALVTELGISLDRLIHGDEERASAGSKSRSREYALTVRPGDRKLVELSSGVRWEELASEPGDGVDFFEVVYEVGAVATDDQSLIQHDGREYGVILSGALGMQVGSDTYTLRAGDSISFSSKRPHRLWNVGEEPAHAIWLIYRDPRHTPDSSGSALSS